MAKGEKAVLDACCGGRMMWFNKAHPDVCYMDNHPRSRGCIDLQPGFHVSPDLVADFRSIPFPDKSFWLVAWDPPHIIDASPRGVMGKKFGSLRRDTWRHDLLDGFNECWRVLRPCGTMIFKWGEASVSLREVLDLFPVLPMFGHTTAKSGKTKWMCFFKEPTDERCP
jgi:hypothetical protein